LDEPKTRFITESILSAPSISDLSYPPFDKRRTHFSALRNTSEGGGDDDDHNKKREKG
jgi:hypothetical protein